jgi:hypothetical protein
VDVLHVTPLDDVVEHDTSTCEPDCACGPEVRPEPRPDGSMSWLIVHHSLDGREQTENEPTSRPSGGLPLGGAMNVGKIAKTVVAALFAAVTVIYSAVSDDVYTTTEIVNTVLAVLTALGVWAVPNAKQSDLSQR